MASKAVVVAYDVPYLTPDGSVLIQVKAIFADTVAIDRTKALCASVVLDPVNPAGWTDAIKAGLIDVGVEAGYGDLTSADVFVFAYV